MGTNKEREERKSERGWEQIKKRRKKIRERMGTNKEREERKSEREWKQIRERMGKNNEIFINKSDRIK